ncbi:MAG: HAD family phosphatase [Tabrizicola sp.]|nr:HAD family phosphatase [Tabrizicola sp.]
MTRPVKAVVFDIGNVLIRWDPHMAFLPDLGSRAAVDAFFDRIDFYALNLRADGGESFADLAAALPDPDDGARLAGYVNRYAATVAEPIESSWALLEPLRDAGREIHAITNSSAETWPVGVAAHPRLATSFGVVIVSGQDRVLKPQPGIFALLCDRAGLAPEDCVFIDDSERNVAGARAFGMDAIHFTTPPALEAALTAREIL